MTGADPTLLLIGMGLDSKDLSSKSIDALRQCDHIYAERYTTPVSEEQISFVESETGKQVLFLSRSDLEEDVKKTVNRSQNDTVAILVPGDPLIATTHRIIINEARNQGIVVKVFHSSSILSAAIGESSLDFYRFGPTVTVPRWSAHYEPCSFIDSISRNLKEREHTLLLFDIDPKKGETLGILEAIGIVRKAARRKRSRRISDASTVIVLGDVGREDQVLFLSTIGKLLGDHSMAEALKGKRVCIVIPSSLSFAEKEALLASMPDHR